MLGIGWSEMLVIAVVALIVVGPKDLPMMLRNLGRMMGTMRRMSNDFHREIDKAIAADEFREAKKAISDPLQKTTEEIRNDFNALNPDGRPMPSGKIVPSQPGKESVVDELRAQAGLAPAAPAAQEAPATTVPAKAKAKSTPAAKAAPTEPAAPRKAAAKKSAPKASKVIEPASAGAGAAPKAKAPARKKAAKTASAKDS